MGAWNNGIFGNDAALDWLDDLEDVADAAALLALVRRPFAECAAFAAEQVDGVVISTPTPGEIEAMIAHAVSATKSAKAREKLASELRACFPAQLEDYGTRPAQQGLAAATFVLARAGGDVAERNLLKLGGVAADWRPDAAVIAEARATVAALASHADRLRQDRRWKQKIVGLLAALDALTWHDPVAVAAQAATADSGEEP